MKSIFTFVIIVILAITTYSEVIPPSTKNIPITLSFGKEVFVVAHGDARHVANIIGWPAQKEFEEKIKQIVEEEGFLFTRCHNVHEHGFIDSQKMGMEVFKKIPKKEKLIVVMSIWSYSHHVLAGLRDHEGPILLLANWSGQFPGLVSMLNLAGSLTKMNKKYSRLWTKDGSDAYFRTKFRNWLKYGTVNHDMTHIQTLTYEHDLIRNQKSNFSKFVKLGTELAKELKRDKSIMCVFDEGSMGMYNAIIDDEYLNPIGIYKERLSQSALYVEMKKVRDDEAYQIRKWLDEKGMKFKTGTDEATELTDKQILEQCKMYIAAIRMANQYGCETIGIQYQLGLKDLTPASDLVEGLLNNIDRPPVFDPITKKELYPNQAIPHFNEVDEAAGVDALLNQKVWTLLNMDSSTTLHDVRYGEEFNNEFVWVFLISGGAPANHFIDGYKGAVSERQPPMYFPFGGGTLKGISKPGHIVWSRIFLKDFKLQMDMGIAKVVELPKEETERRWNITTPQWPIMHGVLEGVTKEQFMGRHYSNHIQVVYADNRERAKEALITKASMAMSLGIIVNICGNVLSE